LIFLPIYFISHTEIKEDTTMHDLMPLAHPDEAHRMYAHFEQETLAAQQVGHFCRVGKK
jgi:hypothetical protein